MAIKDALFHVDPNFEISSGSPSPERSSINEPTSNLLDSLLNTRFEFDHSTTTRRDAEGRKQVIDHKAKKITTHNEDGTLTVAPWVPEPFIPSSQRLDERRERMRGRGAATPRGSGQSRGGRGKEQAEDTAGASTLKPKKRPGRPSKKSPKVVIPAKSPPIELSSSDEEPLSAKHLKELKKPRFDDSSDNAGVLEKFEVGGVPWAIQFRAATDQEQDVVPTIETEMARGKKETKPTSPAPIGTGITKDVVTENPMLTKAEEALRLLQYTPFQGIPSLPVVGANVTRNPKMLSTTPTVLQLSDKWEAYPDYASTGYDTEGVTGDPSTMPLEDIGAVNVYDGFRGFLTKDNTYRPFLTPYPLEDAGIREFITPATVPTGRTSDNGLIYNQDKTLAFGLTMSATASPPGGNVVLDSTEVLRILRMTLTPDQRKLIAEQLPLLFGKNPWLKHSHPCFGRSALVFSDSKEPALGFAMAHGDHVLMGTQGALLFPDSSHGVAKFAESVEQKKQYWSEIRVLPLPVGGAAMHYSPASSFHPTFMTQADANLAAATVRRDFHGAGWSNVKRTPTQVGADAAWANVQVFRRMEANAVVPEIARVISNGGDGAPIPQLNAALKFWQRRRIDLGCVQYNPKSVKPSPLRLTSNLTNPQPPTPRRFATPGSGGVGRKSSHLKHSSSSPNAPGFPSPTPRPAARKPSARPPSPDFFGPKSKRPRRSADTPGTVANRGYLMATNEKSFIRWEDDSTSATRMTAALVKNFGQKAFSELSTSLEKELQHTGGKDTPETLGLRELLGLRLQNVEILVGDVNSGSARETEITKLETQEQTQMTTLALHALRHLSDAEFEQLQFKETGIVSNDKDPKRDELITALYDAVRGLRVNQLAKRTALEALTQVVHSDAQFADLINGYMRNTFVTNLQRIPATFRNSDVTSMTPKDVKTHALDCLEDLDIEAERAENFVQVNLERLRTGGREALSLAMLCPEARMRYVKAWEAKYPKVVDALVKQVPTGVQISQKFAGKSYLPDLDPSATEYLEPRSAPLEYNFDLREEQPKTKEEQPDQPEQQDPPAEEEETIPTFLEPEYE